MWLGSGSILRLKSYLGPSGDIINTAHHLVIGMTPFEDLYDYVPQPISHYILGSTSVKTVDNQL